MNEIIEINIMAIKRKCYYLTVCARFSDEPSVWKSDDIGRPVGIRIFLFICYFSAVYVRPIDPTNQVKKRGLVGRRYIQSSFHRPNTCYF